MILFTENNYLFRKNVVITIRNHLNHAGFITTDAPPVLMTLAPSQAINNMWDDKIRSSINENALEKCMSLGNFWQTTGVPDELEVSSGHRTGPVSQFICLTCSGSCCRPGWQGCIVTGWCQRNVTELLNFCNCKHNSDNSIKGHDQDRPMTGSAECKTQRSSCYGHCHHLALLQSNGQTEVKKRRGEQLVGGKKEESLPGHRLLLRWAVNESLNGKWYSCDFRLCPLEGMPQVGLKLYLYSPLDRFLIVASVLCVG